MCNAVNKTENVGFCTPVALTRQVKKMPSGRTWVCCVPSVAEVGGSKPSQRSMTYFAHASTPLLLSRSHLSCVASREPGVAAFRVVLMPEALSGVHMYGQSSIGRLQRVP